ncbi:MAG: hypothetical protein KDA85_21130 [Planctomycetaceae bacterium]|nr:hypothetical protein [Planctomycetaceae bacterium]
MKVILMQESRPPFLLMQIPLVLSGLTYLAVAVLLAMLPSLGAFEQDPEFPSVILLAIGLFSGVLGIAAIVLAIFVPRQHKGIYITCLVITVMYVPSIYFLFGIPMLIFLLRKDSRAYYGL